MQAEINIGLLGHVDHGKTTLTKALTGKWTDTHSEEIKRGISIRLGYANAEIYHNKETGKYSLKKEPGYEFSRRISFVDAPGHETLMTTVISASSILDGALFLIAANEECPQPQTAEHLMVLNSIGIKNIIVVQTKIDLATKEKALENYKQIKEFLKGSVAENAPIVPVAANYGINLPELIKMIEETIKTPQRDEKAKIRMHISRSFDINKPGTPIKELKGGVIGGSIIQGVLKIGDKVELKPGIAMKEGGKVQPLKFTINSLREENEKLTEAKPGGLIAIGTDLDPAITKTDILVGAVVGHVNELPDALEEFRIKYEVLKRKGSQELPLKEGEPVVVNAQTATSVGIVMKIHKGTYQIKLKKPIVIESNYKIAISRKIGQRWKLSGWGKLQ
ncbi:MAG: translation initiation factor IF-2 subunit gamma [Candidatus Micrarchaeota archaeon]